MNCFLKKSLNHLYIFLTFVLFYGCTSSPDSYGTNNSSNIPIAPINLHASAISPTQINVEWYPSSTNETGYRIERKIAGGDFILVGTVSANNFIFSDVGLTPYSIYTYRICAFNNVGSSQFSKLTSASTPNFQLPQLITTNITSITSTSAISGGTITNDGYSTITERGVIWSTTSIPTISLPTHTNDGNGTGTFSSSITGLQPNTTYYVVAYTHSQLGYSYGNQVSFTTTGPTITDIDGNLYETITFCDKTWTKTNLNVSHYRNGDIIPQVNDPSQLASLTTGAWCYYNNDPANGTVYGKLYNWYAVTDPRGLAPVGYHIPSFDEWYLFTNCNGVNTFGYKIKESGTSHWHTSNAQSLADNSTGFTGLPGGYWPNPNMTYGNGLTYNGKWWSSTVHPNLTTAWEFDLFFDNDLQSCHTMNKYVCLSIRCVKD